jgi:capsid portal protein
MGVSSSSSTPSVAATAITFKELGDPRILSRGTGKFYLTADDYAKETQGRRRRPPWRKGEMQRDPGTPATEIWHLRLPFGGNSVYGVPRWCGAYPSAVGSRNLDEENMRIAADDVVPSLLISVSGGRVDGQDQKRIEDQINERKAGHKRILILQARSERAAGPSPTPTIKVDKLKSEQTTDALFQNYDERNEDKLDGSFRMPRVLLGKELARDRAGLLAIYRFAQDQIFGPARGAYDDEVNSDLMPLLGARYHRYRTITPTPVDPEALGTMIANLLDKGVLTPNESRQAMEDSVKLPLARLPGTWANIPPKMLTAVLQTKNQVTEAALMDPNVGAKELAEAIASAVPEPTPAGSAGPDELGPDGQPIEAEMGPDGSPVAPDEQGGPEDQGQPPASPPGETEISPGDANGNAEVVNEPNGTGRGRKRKAKK